MKEEKDNIKDVDSKLSTKNTQFSGRVLAAINEMCTTELCRPGIKLNEHINKLFPTEQSLAQLDGIMTSLEQEVDDLDGELARLVEAFGEAGAVGTSALNAARESMSDLEKRLERVRSRTQMSDSSVLTMTRDINQLDTAKRNLTSSITTLHHLHILLSGVNSLNNWIAARRYADIASELPAVLNVLQLFDAYIHVEQVKNLTERVEKLKADLSMQLSADLKLVFQSGNINQNAIDMCKVTAVVGGKLEQDFQKWYVDQQFGEYIVLYSDSEDVAWVDKVDHRYRWYVTKLAEFERNGMGKVFPASWEMGRRMSMEFCLITRQALDRLMTRRRNELDWKLLAHAINHTIMFENLLCKRFPSKGEFNFEKIIWQVFNKYMDIFVEAQSKNLTEFLDGCANKIRTGEEKPVKDTSTHAFPLPSSADLFLLLKKIITETSKLCAEPDKLLKQLVLVFRQCLRGYAHGCLTAFLPQVTTQNSITTTSLLQNLIGEETIVRLTPDQQFFTCCILATADWCAETTQQLQEKLKQKIPEIDFSQEMELFYNISNTALNTLVQDVEAACDAALQMMTKINWAGIETVGDESGYISAIRTHLRQYVPLIRDYFSDRRKYFAHFCLKLATQLVNKFYGSILRCKPISISGAEQLLLDTHALKVFLLNMPSLESSIVTKPPTLFTTTVNKTMTKAEMVLKVVMTDVTKPDEFVINYSRMLPESDSSELQKILEMRSMRRSEQQQIIAIYRHKIEGIEPAPATSSMPSAFSAVVSLAADGIADSSMRRLEKLVKKKL
uniref:Vacuolar protein sorting-associated protein 53 homolog n=1 Tax=Panagrolaimus sp. PS1159 TaxID=55785 RepID=A0AC35ETN6_9BILA